MISGILKLWMTLFQNVMKAVAEHHMCRMSLTVDGDVAAGVQEKVKSSTDFKSNQSCQPNRKQLILFIVR